MDGPTDESSGLLLVFYGLLPLRKVLLLMDGPPDSSCGLRTTDESSGLLLPLKEGPPDKSYGLLLMDGPTDSSSGRTPDYR